MVRALAGKVPVILNVNGHDRNGKAAPYKQIRCINMAKRGMLALNLEWFGIRLSAQKNQSAKGEARIDAAGSRVQLWIMPTNEELHLIRDVFDPSGLRKAELKI